MKSEDLKRFDLALSGPKWVAPKRRELEPQRIVCTAGTRVKCPGCADHVGTINSTVYSGISIRADQIDFRPHQKRKANEKAVCSKCAAVYMRLPRNQGARPGILEVFTDLGWI